MPDGAYEKAVDINDHVDHSNAHGLLIPTLADAWVPMLLAAWDNDIVIVCSCPNTPRPLGNLNPQRFGRADNPLITVCRLEETGRQSPDNGVEAPATLGTEADNPKFVGHIDIYAIGEGLSLPFSNSILLDADEIRPPLNSWEHGEGGSSFSTPQISALSSYFAASPQFVTLPPGLVAMSRKTQLVKLSRTNGPNYDTPGAAYNGIRDIYCGGVGPIRRRALE